MSAKLNFTAKILAFADSKDSNNPRLRYADWYRHIPSIEVGTVKGGENAIIEPGGSKTFFDGTRSTTIDGTTAFSIDLSPLDPSRYRITHTAGTSPGFRASRNLTPSGIALTFTVNANATATLTSASAVFAAVQVADIVFVPNTSTGDSANVISAANSGYWQVLSTTSSTSITLIRFAGEDFSAQNEVVTPTSNAQLVAFGASGVQVGDSVDIAAGFATTTRRIFRVEAITDTFFEIISTTALPSQTAIIPGVSGLNFYTSSKQFMYLECNQECVVRVNGDTGNFQRVAPIDPSDPNKPGIYVRFGPTWSLTVVNRSAFPAEVTNLIYAE